jgi:pimeloyl-ACP methyl ester carboxylesterase
MAQILLGHILTLLPFFEPENGEPLIIPQKVGGQWSPIHYKVQRIQMTENYMGSPLYAYGLEPATDSGSAPLLLFMGTPFPTASGALLALWSDTAPTYTVGEVVYTHFAGDKIRAWLESIYRETHRKADVYGVSLGGSLGLIAASYQPNLIDRVYAYNPKGLTSDTLDLYEYNTQKWKMQPNVKIYWNHNDPIPLIGKAWHEDWTLFRIINTQSQNPYFSHIRIFAGQGNVAAIRSDIRIANREVKRKWMNVAHQFVSLPAFALKSLVIGSRALYYLASQTENQQPGSPIMSQPPQWQGES